MKLRELNHSIELRLTEQVAHDAKVANYLNLIHWEQPDEKSDDRSIYSIHMIVPVSAFSPKESSCLEVDVH